MVAGDDLASPAGLAVVEQDEIPDQVEEAVLGEHAVQQDLGFHAALVFLVVALPLGEVLPFAGDGTVAGAVAVADDKEGVVVKCVIDARLAEVVGQVIIEAGPHVQIDGLQFHEDQRQAVDVADEVGAAVVMGDAEALNLELPDGEEPVVGRAVRAITVLEIYDLGAGVFSLAAGISPLDGDTVTDEVVILAVVLDERAGEVHPGQFLNGLFARGFGEVRVEALQGGAEVAGEDDFALAGAAEGAGGAEGFVVVRVKAFPAEDIMQVIGKGLLDQAVFAIDVGCHAWSGADAALFFVRRFFSGAKFSRNLFLGPWAEQVGTHHQSKRVHFCHKLLSVFEGGTVGRKHFADFVL